MKPALALIAAALMAGTGLSHAEDVGQHPAVFAPRALPGVNPSTFIVGHPASPKVRDERANYEHPAVVLARRGVPQTIDANTFLVQPPAMVAWEATAPAAAAVPVGQLAAVQQR